MSGPAFILFIFMLIALALRGPARLDPDMTRNKIIDRVRKLLALANSTNAHEAATAAAAAQSLMSAHRIAAAECEAPEASDIGLHDSVSLGRRRLDQWRWQMAWGVCKPNGCVPTTVWGSDDRLVLCFVGHAPDAQAARYLWEYLVREIDRLAKAEALELRQMGGAPANWRTWYNSFRMGAVMAVSVRLLRTAKQAQHSASSQAIARLDDHEAQAREFAREKLGVTYSDAKLSDNLSSDGFDAGRDAGARIPLSAGPGRELAPPKLALTAGLDGAGEP